MSDGKRDEERDQEATTAALLCALRERVGQAQQLAELLREETKDRHVPHAMARLLSSLVAEAEQRCDELQDAFDRRAFVADEWEDEPTLPLIDADEPMADVIARRAAKS